ncbi:MAG: hypothetical protein M1830_002764 [Pleopsidium flavum]|nr:MAG: hypothetical protein M1830_002764 [Pleopsidium flavum]
MANGSGLRNPPGISDLPMANRYGLRNPPGIPRPAAMQKPREPVKRTISQHILAAEAPLLYQRAASNTGTLSFGGFDGPSDSTDRSRVSSIAWSTISHRIFSDSTGCSDQRDTSAFFHEYNTMAKKYGLPCFFVIVKLPEPPKAPEEVEAASRAKPGWLLRFLRKSTSFNSVKAQSTQSMTRKVSIGSLPIRPRKDTFSSMTLEEIARLGGVSILTLPVEFAAAKLAIPTCICASATCIMLYGRRSAGIFRIPGQLSTVNALYDYYVHELEIGKIMSDNVVQAVGHGSLPTHIHYNIQDIASLFKKFLAGIGGGILGSLPLFVALLHIKDHLFTDPNLTENHQQALRARLIALTISCVNSEFRISLICAVLGLLAMIGHEAESKIQEELSATGYRPTTELMGYQALCVVFAPLLLGDLTDEIKLSPTTRPEHFLDVPNSPEKRGEDKKKNASVKLPKMPNTLAMHVERAKIAASVLEMLLTYWQAVVPQLRNIGAMEGHCTIAEQRSRMVSQHRRCDTNVLETALRCEPYRHWEASMRLKQSVTIGADIFQNTPQVNHRDVEVRVAVRERMEREGNAGRERALRRIKSLVTKSPTKIRARDRAFAQWGAPEDEEEAAVARLLGSAEGSEQPNLSDADHPFTGVVGEDGEQEVAAPAVSKTRAREGSSEGIQRRIASLVTAAQGPSSGQKTGLQRRMDAAAAARGRQHSVKEVARMFGGVRGGA